MGGLSTLGGLLALIGGLFILVQTLMYWNLLWATNGWCLYINIGIGGCGLVGGVFGMKGQRGAGAVALIVGILSMVFGLLLTYVVTNYNLWQLSLFSETIMGIPYDFSNLFAGISLEAILLTVGGVLVVAGGGNE